MRVQTVNRGRVDDGLFIYLVGAMFTSTATLAASMIMGALVILCGWLVTEAPVFKIYLALNAIIGIARIDLVIRFKRQSSRRISRAAAEALDQSFSFWSTLYALVLGVTAYSLISFHEQEQTTPLAVGICVGFSMAYVLRSAGRYPLLVMQAVATSGPAIYGYATLPVAHGGLYATTISGLLVSIFVLGRAANGKLIELYRANEKNSRMARLDGLPGLMNRFAFSESLGAAMQPGVSSRLAVFIIDLDRFKEINDTLGHSVGDAVIIEMAARIRSALKEDDILARLGGDEFVILMQLPGSGDIVRREADRLVEALSRPMTIEQMCLPASASIGVAVYPDHARSGEELMKLADIALYEAKHRGRNAACVFSASMQSRINDIHLLKSEIQFALQEGHFEPWFQPILDIRSGRIVGYEALARWRHPAMGLIAPDRFIPLAEQSGLIFDIGEMILEKACRAATGWPDGETIAVNFSPVQFRRPQALVDMVRRVLERTGLDSSRLYVEITESVLMEDTPQTRAAAKELDSIGVRFSLDDFGAGYSSLSYIQLYPFSKVKIDKRFIDHIDSDKTSRSIVKAVLALADGVGLDVVAEGIETNVQHAALLEIGLKQAQGYFYGKPAPLAVAQPLKAVS